MDTTHFIKNYDIPGGESTIETGISIGKRVSTLDDNIENVNILKSLNIDDRLFWNITVHQLKTGERLYLDTKWINFDSFGGKIIGF